MNGFIKTKGILFVDGSGEQFLIKGIAFGNEVWGNPKNPPKHHHTEDSYKELADLGFNSIRFYLNYALFEDDGSPYEYKQSGWDWLDWNISMAHKYNIRLVLNMHYPQGGFQSNSNSMELWTDAENQNRLVALWTEIARRYRDETAIAVFDLVNEPVVPLLGTIEESFRQWETLAQRITDGIRSVNQNHVIMVERLNAIKNMSSGNSNWDVNMNGRLNYITINDDNKAYTFHNYDPFYFTHQNANWVPGFSGVFGKYPDEKRGANKDELEKSITKYLQFGIEQDVPLYLGEFGVISYGFEEERGGEIWIADALDICKRHNINFNYHTYHEPAFGLYRNNASEEPGKLNQKLYDAFKNNL